MNKLENKKLHLISFDVPFPANYGGVIDVFHKINSLHKIGVKVILHCFQYGREKSNELSEICEKVYYYERNKSLITHFSIKPYIVKSRALKSLYNNLSKDDYPILFEGIHTTAFIPHFPKKRVFIRAHNVEWEYYKNLHKSEKRIVKRIFFWIESRRLKIYEKKIYEGQKVFAISEADRAKLNLLGGNVTLLNPFHANTFFNEKVESSDYALYHGNLNINDNENAALFFINLFKSIPNQLVIAGLNPSKNLKSKIANISNIQLIESPHQDELKKLIANAKLNLFFSNHSSGVKLKLINALFNANHCLIGKEFVVNDDFKHVCTVVEQHEWEEKILKLFKTPFDKNSLEKRNRVLMNYSNDFNLNSLCKVIFN